jgi:hypothetical protein
MDKTYNLTGNIGAEFEWYDVLNKPLFTVVAPRGSILYKQYEYILSQQARPGRLFATIQEALAALPSVPQGQSGLAANVPNDFLPATIYVAPGLHSSATPVIVPTSKSGTKIYFEKGAILQATADLGANTSGLLELQGEEIKLTGFPRLTTNTGGSNTQAGCALIVGGNGNTASGEGTGRGCLVENVVVDGYGGNRDFANDLTIRGASDVVVKNSTFLAFTDTVDEIIRVISSGAGRPGARLRLEDVIAEARNDSGNTVIPLSVASGQDHGEVIGGLYSTDSATTDCVVIASANWYLGGGGLAINSAAVGNKAQIDYSGTGARIGVFYVKQKGGATAASLLSQANI